MANLKEAIEYASKNPNSDFANELTRVVKSGAVDSEAKTLGIDLTPIKEYTTTTVQDKGATGVKGVGVGIAKGLGSTLTGLGTLANKGLGLLPGKVGDFFEGGADYGKELLTAPDSPLVATTPSQKFGKTTEQIAEFFIPASKVATAEKILATASKVNIIARLTPILGEEFAKKIGTAIELGTKIAIRGAEGASVTAAQTGGDMQSVKDAGIISALFPVVGKGVDVVKQMGAGFAPRLVNSLIKPLAKDLSYGKNPGRAVAEEGITASSLDELVIKITERRQQIGQEIGDIVSNVKGVIVNAVKSINPIDEALATANKSPKTNQALISRLEALKSDLFDGVDLSKMTIEDVFKLKSQVTDLTKFTGNASDDALVNKSLKRIYGSLKDMVNKTAGNLKSKSGKTITELNEKYADLSSAEVATKYRDAITQRANIVSLPSNIIGVGSALITSMASGGNVIPTLLAGAGGLAIEKASSSPLVKTKIASWLAKASPEEKSRLFKAVPALRGIIIKSFIGE